MMRAPGACAKCSRGAIRHRSPREPVSKPIMRISPMDPIAGVLVPVFAIRAEGDLGIGDTSGVCEFIDWAADIGFRLVKILPIN